MKTIKPFTPRLRAIAYSKYFRLHEQGKTIPASHDVNFDVYDGKLTALVGPTGVGKSSVLKGVFRSYVPVAGQLIYRTKNNEEVDLAIADDHKILALRKTEISFVTQFLHSLPRQATEDVVAQPLIHQGVDRAQALNSAREMLSAMKLPERLWSISPATFSGGEKQRVNLARGFVSKPKLLLLDEPTASLDKKTAECIIELIEGLKIDGVAMLAIFHDPQVVKRLADLVVELKPPVAIEQMLEEIA